MSKYYKILKKKMAITILKTKEGYSAWWGKYVFTAKTRVEALMKVVRIIFAKYDKDKRFKTE